MPEADGRSRSGMYPSRVPGGWPSGTGSLGGAGRPPRPSSATSIGGDVDGVLRLMTRLPGVRIEEETNQKALKARDREAAVIIGERAQHVLAMEEL